MNNDVIEKAINAALTELRAMKPESREPEPPAEEIAIHAGDMIRAGYLPHDRQAFDTLSKWFAGNRRKGLLLLGKAGAGKTFFFETFGAQERIIQSTWFVGAYRKFQSYNDGFWFEALGIRASHTSERHTVVIDDLGKEPKSVLYGQVEEVMDRVICQRYDDWKRHKCLTHFTANLGIADLDQRYGRRITDRLREMCVLVTFNGQSQRGRI